jgi:hypothetical protein
MDNVKFDGNLVVYAFSYAWAFCTYIGTDIYIPIFLRKFGYALWIIGLV